MDRAKQSSILQKKKKCRACGNEYELARNFNTVSFIGMELGFQFAMILLGGYVAVCFYSFQSIFALAASLLVGVIIFYALLPKNTEMCEACNNERNN